MSSRRKLTVYSRSYCHLCDEMVAGLHALRATHSFELEVIDVDTDAALTARYDHLVPVLMADDVELCHYHLDRGRVSEYLNNLL